MNKGFVIQQLREAREGIDDLIREMESDDNGFGTYYALLPVIYRSLNLSWNSTKMEEEDFLRTLKEDGLQKEIWGFPAEHDMYIHD